MLLTLETGKELYLPDPKRCVFQEMAETDRKGNTWVMATGRQFPVVETLTEILAKEVNNGNNT